MASLPCHKAIITVYQAIKDMGFSLETQPTYTLRNKELGLTVIQPNKRSNQVALVTSEGDRYNCIISTNAAEFIQDYIERKEKGEL